MLNNDKSNLNSMNILSWLCAMCTLIWNTWVCRAEHNRASFGVLYCVQPYAPQHDLCSGPNLVGECDGGTRACIYVCNIGLQEVNMEWKSFRRAGPLSWMDPST